MVPTRRRLLSGAAAGGAAALAGCMVFTDGCTHSLTLEMERSTVEDVVDREVDSPGALHPVGASLVGKVREDGAATFWAVRPPPLRAGEYLVLGDDESASGRRYVRVLIEVVEETTVTGYEFELSIDAERTPETDETVLEFLDLSAADQRAFLAALGFPPPEKIEGANAMSGPGTIAFAEPSRVEASDLVPEPAADYVRYRGRNVRLSKTGTTDATVETHEVTFEEVATTDGAFAALVRDRQGVVLEAEALSEDQREILEEAIDEGYRECEEFSEALTGLRDRLEEAGYANYEGTWYRVSLVPTVV